MKSCTLDVCLTVHSITCDICNVRFDKDDIAFDECISISHFTGPASIYGAEKQINLDVCQHCFSDLLGNHADVSDASDWQCQTHRKQIQYYSE
ncbi:MAG: hypothetical protein ACPGTQ_04820 [Colwellia sp.]